MKSRKVEVVKQVNTADTYEYLLMCGFVSLDFDYFHSMEMFL